MKLPCYFCDKPVTVGIKFWARIMSRALYTMIKERTLNYPWGVACDECR